MTRKSLLALGAFAALALAAPALAFSEQESGSASAALAARSSAPSFDPRVSPLHPGYDGYAYGAPYGYGYGGLRYDPWARYDSFDAALDQMAGRQGYYHGEPWGLGVDVAPPRRAAQPRDRARDVERARPKRERGDPSCEDCREHLDEDSGLWVLGR